MAASEQMIAAVERYRREAKSAESTFDFRNEMIQIKSQSSIDLFGGRASSQVADIASAVREACDDLYASYQTLIQRIDRECRPLLSRDPSTRAVKEVMELIRWLNSESEIGSNFTGSLNGASMGDLVSVRYIPSMENKMIQKYWERHYASMPGTAAEDAAYRTRQAEARRAEREAKRRAIQEEREWERQEAERARKKKEQEKQERLARIAEKRAETEERRKYLRDARGMIGGGMKALLWVKQDGTVGIVQDFFALDGNPGDVSRFRDIRSVVCTWDGIVGLRRNGTCIATNPGKYCDAHILEANGWRNVVALAAGAHHVVGLRSNGTCVANSIKWNVGYGYDGQSNVSEWTDIRQIACGDYFTVGLKKDGTLVYTGQGVASEATRWKDIELIGAGSECVLGVTKTGELKIAGKGHTSAMETAENIVQLVVSGHTAYALQADGTVLGGRPDRYDPDKPVIAARDAVAIARGDGLLVLKENGSLEQINGRSLKVPYGTKLFSSYRDYRMEQVAREEARILQEQQRAAWQKAGLCRNCGGTFKKGLFSTKCTQCGKHKDY